MDGLDRAKRRSLVLVSTNVMRIAGIQGIFGEPLGIDISPSPLNKVLHTAGSSIVLVDAGSVTPLFEVLGVFRDHSPQTKLIVIGQEADDTYIECVISAGARGFVSGGANAKEFAVALENVEDGSIWAPRRVLSHLIHDQLNGHRPEVKPKEVRFTSRENEIIALLIGGQSNREIGRHLGIEAVTVKAHLSRIMRKTGLCNRLELGLYAIRRQGTEVEPTNRPGA